MYMHLCLGVQLSTVDLPDIIEALDDISDPYLLGFYLKIKTSKLEEFEGNNCKATQKMEVLDYWLNNADVGQRSWKGLADAVKKMGSYGYLVTNLNQRHLDALENEKKIKHEA